MEATTEAERLPELRRLARWAVRRWAPSIGPRHPDYEDAMQVALWACVRGDRDFDPTRGLRRTTCIITYARNDLSVWLRKLLRCGVMYHPETPNVAPWPTNEDGEDWQPVGRECPPDRAAIRGEWWARLNALHPAESQALRLSCEGHTYRQIAPIMGVCHERVRQLVDRATIRLRRQANRQGVLMGKAPPWSAGERRRARKLRAQGWTWDQIGRAIGRPGEGVRMHISKRKKRRAAAA